MIWSVNKLTGFYMMATLAFNKLIVGTNDIAEIQKGNISIKSSSSENLLGVNTDSQEQSFTAIPHNKCP